MSFTVQSKPAEEKTTKWKNAGKIVIISPTNWGRIPTMVIYPVYRYVSFPFISK